MEWRFIVDIVAYRAITEEEEGLRCHRGQRRTPRLMRGCRATGYQSPTQVLP